MLACLAGYDFGPRSVADFRDAFAHAAVCSLAGALHQSDTVHGLHLLEQKIPAVSDGLTLGPLWPCLLGCSFLFVYHGPPDSPRDESGQEGGGPLIWGTLLDPLLHFDGLCAATCWHPMDYRTLAEDYTVLLGLLQQG